MRFLLDESADFPLAQHLRDAGHDVTTIAHDHGQALRDEDVLAIAVREHRILITNDHDFGELVVREHLPHAGVVLFRLGREHITVKTAWLDRILVKYADRLSDFLVVTERGIRVRRTR